MEHTFFEWQKISIKYNDLMEKTLSIQCNNLRNYRLQIARLSQQTSAMGTPLPP